MPWYSIYDDLIDFRADITYIKVLEAAELAIKDIMQKYPAPYHLMVSGGVDSQLMMYVWKLFGKNFIPVAVKYNDNLNSHDLETLPQFCEANGIDLIYKNFDVLEFYQKRYPELAEEYSCISPHFGTHIGMAEDLPGTVIYSGDFISKIDKEKLKSLIWAANICMYRASLKRSMIPYFFLHTPELAYSYLYEIVNYNLVNVGGDDDVYASKVSYYQQCGIPVIGQAQKYTGFENVKDYFDAHYKHLITPKIKIKYRLQHSKRTYDLLLRYPYEKKYGVPEFVLKFNSSVKN